MAINFGGTNDLQTLDSIVKLYILFIILLIQKELKLESEIIHFSLYSSKEFALEEFLINDYKFEENSAVKIVTMIYQNKFMRYKKANINSHIEGKRKIEYNIPFLNFKKINEFLDVDSRFFKIAEYLDDLEVLLKF